MLKKRFKPERLIIYIFLLLIIPAMAIYAGGSKKIQEQLNQCQSDVEVLKEENENLKNQNASLSDQIRDLNAEKTQLQQKITELEAKIAEKEKEIEKLEAEAPEPMIVAKTIEEKIQEKEAEIIELKTEKEQLEYDVQKIKQELEQTKRQLAQTNRELMQVNRELTMNNQKLEEANKEISSLNSQVRTLKVDNERLSSQVKEITREKQETEQALMAYERIEKETQRLMDIAMARIKMVLKEEIEKGKVRVYRSSLGIVIDIVGEYMFNTGSVEINFGGKVILGKIASLLDGLEGYMIGVIGNADSKPIVTPSLKKRFPTNWELSVHRGSVVVRYLLEKGRLSPTRVVAMGLGEYYPIDDNTTDEGRGNNRRVDIVLLPVDVMAAVLVGAEVK